MEKEHGLGEAAGESVRLILLEGFLEIFIFLTIEVNLRWMMIQ